MDAPPVVARETLGAKRVQTQKSSSIDWDRRDEENFVPGNFSRNLTNNNVGMTQDDCVEWDERRHTVDLRKLADPTFSTPADKALNNNDDETPSSEKSAQSEAKRVPRFRRPRRPATLCRPLIDITESDIPKSGTSGRKRPFAVTGTVPPTTTAPIHSSISMLMPAPASISCEKGAANSSFGSGGQEFQIETNVTRPVGPARVSITRTSACETPGSKLSDNNKNNNKENENRQMAFLAPAPLSVEPNVVDEFGDIDFSLDDLTKIDTLVDEITHSQESAKVAPKPINTTTSDANVEADIEDPFGDVPDVDFDALIVENGSTTNAYINSSKRSLVGRKGHPAPDVIPVDTARLRTQIIPTSTMRNQSESINVTRNTDEFPDISDFELLDPLCSVPILQPPSTEAPVRNPRVSQSTAGQCSRGFLSLSRYKVLLVDHDVRTFTQTLTLATWTTAMMADEDQLTSILHHGHSRRGINKSKKQWPIAGVVHLRGEWYHTKVAVDDSIHIVSINGDYRTDHLPLILHTYPPNGSDIDDLVLIVHPDLLLTPTTITETISCSRRAVLKNRLGSSGLTNKAALFGTMRHALFEESMKEQDFSVESARKHVQNIVQRNSEGLLSCDVSSREAEKEILKFLPQLQRFANEYTEFGQTKGSKHLGQMRYLEVHGNGSPTQFVAKSVHAIEEPFVSPELGLKGNVDMLVHALTVNRQSIQQQSESILGVELKTGHNQTPQKAHIAQLAFYIVMLQTRYGNKRPNTSTVGAAESGLLLYMSSEAIRAVHIAPILNEIKSLIGMRNLVATELIRSTRPRGIQLSYEEDKADASKLVANIGLMNAEPVALPELLPNSYSCKKCYSNRECMMYAAAERSSFKLTAADRTHQELLHHFTGHLGEEELTYFTVWDRLVDLEANATDTVVTRNWLMHSDERESATSNCVSSLAFDETVSSADKVFDEAWYSIIGFLRSTDSTIKTPLSNVGFEAGSRVIISADRTTTQNSNPFQRSRPQMHIVRGIIHVSKNSHIQVLASRDDLTRIQNIVKESSDNTPLFRIDKDTTATGIGTLRQNLVNLFTLDTMPKEGIGSHQSKARLSWLRDVLIRLRKPTFDNNLVQSMFTPINGAIDVPGCDLMDLCFECSTLNPDQKAAAETAISANDYAVIQGLPGTGKTFTIAFVARLLAALGKRVLITSYTHAAVDNVLLKLIEYGVASCDNAQPLPSVVRIGRKASSHPGVHRILASSIAINLEAANNEIDEFAMPSAESLRRAVSAARIVGVTALTVPRSPLLIGEHFDVVIVDEAGQISQPAIIGPLMAADKFVLVGDHMQLPPLVVSELAVQGGYAVSMLKRLAEAHPNSVSQLTYQYRMHKDICQLSNDIVYKGRLKCANNNVANRQLHLTGFPENLPATINQGTDTSSSWLHRVIDPSTAVVFLDTDKITVDASASSTDQFQPLERNSGRFESGSIVNDTEAHVVRVVAGALVQCGLTASSVGVICPFRAQIRLLEKCPTLSALESAGLELSTIDRYQGRDKSAILLSFVRSNTKGKVGRLIEDFRRLNVAVTRAKCKLIMIGSFSTLHKGSEILKPILEKIRSDGKLVSISANDIDRINF